MPRRYQEEATGRPIYVLSDDEVGAAFIFLRTLQRHLSLLVGDLRMHTLTNVGMSRKTAVLLKDSFMEAAAARDRPFFRLFLETQMFAAHSDAVIGTFEQR
jgi:hypothetical protein